MPSAFHLLLLSLPFHWFIPMRLEVELPPGPEGRWRTMSEEGVVCVGHSSPLSRRQEESQESLAPWELEKEAER